MVAQEVVATAAARLAVGWDAARYPAPKRWGATYRWLCTPRRCYRIRIGTRRGSTAVHNIRIRCCGRGTYRTGDTRSTAGAPRRHSLAGRLRRPFQTVRVATAGCLAAVQVKAAATARCRDTLGGRCQGYLSNMHRLGQTWLHPNRTQSRCCSTAVHSSTRHSCDRDHGSNCSLRT